MAAALEKALNLIVRGDPELLNILGTTARLCFTSSLLALAIGVPVGVWLGSARFRGRGALAAVNRTLMGMPPVVCGLVFYMLFSGVGPFGRLKLIFTVKLMVIAQVALISPIVAGNMESFVSTVAGEVRESAAGLGLGPGRRWLLLMNESVHHIFFTYLLAFARAIAEVGAVSMVGGAIAWKTNVMTTAIMQYTNRGNFSLGLALGIILMAVSLLVNIAVSLVQGRVTR